MAFRVVSHIPILVVPFWEKRTSPSDSSPDATFTAYGPNLLHFRQWCLVAVITHSHHHRHRHWTEINWRKIYSYSNITFINEAIWIINFYLHKFIADYVLLVRPKTFIMLDLMMRIRLEFWIIMWLWVSICMIVLLLICSIFSHKVVVMLRAARRI